MRLIDADALKERYYESMKELLKATGTAEVTDNAISLLCGSSLIIDAPTIDAIPVDWMVQRMNETSSGSGMNIELNNALFAVGVEWERRKKEHEVDECD